MQIPDPMPHGSYIYSLSNKEATKVYCNSQELVRSTQNSHTLHCRGASPYSDLKKKEKEKKITQANPEKGMVLHMYAR